MQLSKPLISVLAKKKSLKDFQPSKILAPGEYEVVDPGRLVRIGNRQFQFVMGGTWMHIISDYYGHLQHHITTKNFQVESGVRITQFKEDGKIDYIHFLTNSEYEKFIS